MAFPSDLGGASPSTRRLVFPIVGVTLVAVAVLLGAVATGLAHWGHSVCTTDPTVVSAERQALRRHLLLIWLTASSVPAVLAVAARATHRLVTPWAALSSMLALVAWYAAHSAEPSTWCLF